MIPRPLPPAEHEETIREKAVGLYRLLERASPLIEQYTSEVCPTCEDVCCKQKHAYFDDEDMIYITALGVEVPEYDERGPEEPCQFLSERGCTRPRGHRPFRCTWYFCPPLLSYMAGGKGRPYRRLVALLKEIGLKREAVTRQEMVEGG